MNQLDDFDQIGFQQSSSQNANFDFDGNMKNMQASTNHNRKMKENTKNTYIKKISSLMKLSPTQEKIEEKSMPEKKLLTKPFQSQQQFNYISQTEKEDKLAKNRESARNSRKRKKIYLELLENKVTKLSEQLDLFKDVNDKTYSLAQNLQIKLTQKKEQDQTKCILFNNLQTSLQNNASEANVDSIIDSLNKKFGSASQERQFLIDHYARQINENCLAPFCNYIIQIAKKQDDIFAQNEQNMNLNLLTQLKLADKQKQILLKKQQKLSKHYQDISNAVTQIMDTKSQIQKELASFDSTLDQLRNELRPSQVAKLLLAIEKKDMQHNFKESFEKFFGHDIEEDDSLDLYQFMTERNQCNSLGIDIQNTYDVFRASHDFLFGKNEELEVNQINGKDI
ncbi:unnamed protein product (macronuclear) [Paramecium tetraurelia]|uniref:BZIP domain-containing protein n=1 Tax=Paramecium tetraurelia TaxID=5888 RepID=A0EDS1_PARTE|nr:uncharacterized protein GSPATT00025782001 [Paramecium tetraurelia]CAK93438.1 unnamed protein product [Paramecium tetraurelia]|eukprot:XP_001460835.1 hypothetical protein (macronuclear) [Paramecium tetraurelia strain d4-2]